MDQDSENDIFSSDVNSYDSDVIDSDIEADLYSVIHHQDTSLINSNEYNTPDKTKYTSNKYSTQEKINVDKSNITEHLNKTKVNDFDKTGKIFSVHLPQNSKDHIEVATIEYQNVNNGNSSKRKSNLVSDLLNNIQSNAKRGKMRASNKEIKISDSKMTVYKDTSDDDSDIICLDVKEREKQFQTNLSKSIISLDSSSDSSDSWYDKFPNRSSISFSHRNSKDLWSINNEDLYRFKRRSNRYHESELVNCSNCGEKGHFAKDCSVHLVMKCYVCSKRHNPIHCRKRTCAKCFRMGHDCRYCKFKIEKCTLCKMTGHPTDECPDLWRRYHLTTSNEGIRASRSFRGEPIFCYNCGISGHFGGKCVKKRMNVTSFQTWPVVINYESPYNTLKPEKNILNLSCIDYREQERRRNIERKIRKKKEKKMLKNSQKNGVSQSLITQIDNLNSNKKEPQTTQNDFPRTPKADIANQNSPDIITRSPDFSKKGKKQFGKKKKSVKKLENLGQKILDRSNNLSVPLHDLSVQNILSRIYSDDILKIMSKRERKRLRKRIAERIASNNISALLLDKN